MSPLSSNLYEMTKSAEGEQPGNMTVITGEYDAGKIGRRKKGSWDTITLVV